MPRDKRKNLSIPDSDTALSLYSVRHAVQLLSRYGSTILVLFSYMIMMILLLYVTVVGVRMIDDRYHSILNILLL